MNKQVSRDLMGCLFIHDQAPVVKEVANYGFLKVHE